MIAAFSDLQALAEIAPAYRALRLQHPDIPARTVHQYLRDGGDGLTLQQFSCSHEWAYTGTAYGGDDERFHGEGRCYCVRCGADGDA